MSQVKLPMQTRMCSKHCMACWLQVAKTGEQKSVDTVEGKQKGAGSEKAHGMHGEQKSACSQKLKGKDPEPADEPDPEPGTQSPSRDHAEPASKKKRKKKRHEETQHAGDSKSKKLKAAELAGL